MASKAFAAVSATNPPTIEAGSLRRSSSVTSLRKYYNGDLALRPYREWALPAAGHVA